MTIWSKTCFVTKFQRRSNATCNSVLRNLSHLAGSPTLCDRERNDELIRLSWSWNTTLTGLTRRKGVGAMSARYTHADTRLWQLSGGHWRIQIVWLLIFSVTFDFFSYTHCWDLEVERCAISNILAKNLFLLSPHLWGVNRQTWGHIGKLWHRGQMLLTNLALFHPLFWSSKSYFHKELNTMGL